MSVLALVYREIRDADQAGKSIDLIRITTDALKCTPAAVPVPRKTPCGAMTMVTFDRELRIHPEDWQDLLVESEKLLEYDPGLRDGIERLYGVPVERGATPEQIEIRNQPYTWGE